MTISECNAKIIAMAFDCEGTIGLQENGGHRCMIGCTDPPLLYHLQALAEGAGNVKGPYPRGDHKANYVWALRARDLLTVLAAIEPYLILKREQAKLLLAMRNAIVERKPIDVSQCYQTMRSLNGNSKRGRPRLGSVPEPEPEEDGKVSGLDFI